MCSAVLSVCTELKMTVAMEVITFGILQNNINNWFLQIKQKMPGIKFSVRHFRSVSVTINR